MYSLRNCLRTIFLACPIAAGAQQVAHVEVMPARASVVAGKATKFRVVAKDTSGKIVTGATVYWAAVPFDIASADSTGNVDTFRAGTGKVYAIVNGKPASAEIEVLERGPARIEVAAPGAASTVVGGILQLDATGFTEVNDRLEDVVVTWKSEQPTIAEVSPAGLVRGKAPGRATIVAQGGGVSGSVAVTVRANPVRSVVVTPVNEAVRTGDVVALKATLRDAQGRSVAAASAPVHWSVSGRGASVDQSGFFVANNAGSYPVTASIGDVSASAAVRVVPRSDRRQVTMVTHIALPKDLQTAEVWPIGDVLYLSTVAGKLYVFDIRNPSAPVLTDSLEVDARVMNDVSTTTDGKIGVITREGASTRKNGLVFFDASDPRHPKKISEFTETVTGGVHSAFIYERAVFATDDATGSLRIIDFSDVNKPRQIARWEVPRDIKRVEFMGESMPGGRMLHDVYVEDGLAYLAYWKDGLIVLDVGKGIKGGTLAAPKLVSQLTYNHAELYPPGFLAGTHAVYRDGSSKYLFLADEVLDGTFNLMSKEALVTRGMVHVIDVSDIEHPRKVAQYDPVEFGAHNLWVENDLLYIGAYDGGIRVMDVSGELRGDLREQGRVFGSLLTRSLQGYRPNQAMTWSAIPHKGYIYASDINSGLWVARVTGGVVP
ncbi:MAG: Ig-like domain-containing protein [Anaerolineae bacterium]|nr:Ig-like domain-containing protein [Gemmatimonadaceae bacterium]